MEYSEKSSSVISVTYDDINVRVLRFTEAIEAYHIPLDFNDNCDILVPWSLWNYFSMFHDADRIREYIPKTGEYLDINVPSGFWRDTERLNLLSCFLTKCEHNNSLMWIFSFTGPTFDLIRLCTVSSKLGIPYRTIRWVNSVYIEDCSNPELLRITLRRFSDILPPAVQESLVKRLHYLILDDNENKL